jgi:hypothetical protein
MGKELLLKTTLRKFARILVIASCLAVLVGIGFTALPSQRHIAHAASCSGNGCTDKDPHDTGCDADAYTVYNVYVRDNNGNEVGLLQLRYSPSCGTNWTRLTSYVGNTWLTANTIRKADSWIEYGGPMFTNVVWSDMVYSPGNYTVYGDGCVGGSGYPGPYCGETALA